MSEELEKILAEDERASAQALAAEKEAAEKKAIEDETKKGLEHLANIKKAIAEANTELKNKRTVSKSEKKDGEEEIPKIDFNDPGSKAWDKHIQDKFSPLSEELAKEKEEIRSFALNEFLADKPELASDAEKLKGIMSMYEKIRSSSERTREGVILDLRKAYAASNAEEILAERDNARTDRAMGDSVFSNPAVSRGSTSFKNEREAPIRISHEDEIVLAKWGMTPAEWVALKKKQEKK